ncbi:MAG TPA: zinc-ribbon domain-containing protein, partial [Nannocystaceae bacterium]|nr:zinc-ribbon domain-containing protein [Nannocystaceae bacterium]
MIVRCASCKTEFALDDRQVGPDGASVRCSVCGAVFRVEAESAAEEPPWQVRTLEDLLFTAPDLATLRTWILEGRLHPDDKVSRTGRHFVRLGDMPEFSAAFEGFSGLPQLVVADGLAPSERSALDVLGPPPAFGTEGADSADSAALPGVPESTGDAPSAALSTAIAAAAGISSSVLELRSSGRPSILDDTGSLDAASVPEDERTVARALVDDEPTNARAVPERVPAVDSPAHGFRPIPATRAPTSPPRVGVPTTITDDRSSRPASMLDAVTQHVRPIRQPVVETARAPMTTPAIEPPPPAPPVAPPPPRQIERSFDFDDDERPRSRGRKSWPVWAALGVLAGSAVVFGIPSVRGKLFGESTTPPVVAQAPDDGAVLKDAERALQSADPAALARAEAALQVTIDGRPSDTIGLEVMRGELLATRALTHELWGAIDPAMRNDARFWAQEDASRAAAVLAELDAGSVPDAARLARAHALLHVAQGRTEASALPEDVELPLLVAATPLLRDDH